MYDGHSQGGTATVAAASHPMTVSEHLAAGALRTEAGAFGSQIDVNPPWVN